MVYIVIYQQGFHTGKQKRARTTSSFSYTTTANETVWRVLGATQQMKGLDAKPVTVKLGYLEFVGDWNSVRDFRNSF